MNKIYMALITKKNYKLSRLHFDFTLTMSES